MKQIKLFEPFFDRNEISNLQKVISSGWVTNGPLTKKFENLINLKIGSKHAIAVNSCTNGIVATIKALDLKPGDEVITTPMTFVSVIHALELFKLKIKLVDINFENFSLDMKLLKKMISQKTKCILVTHYGGIPFNLKPLEKICKKKKIYIIEDAATAFGARIDRRTIGASKYSIAIFSFYANKVITTGEGGVIVLNNKMISSKIRTIISCGISKDPWQRSFQKKIWHYNVNNHGFKFNFTDLQAALGIAQLKKYNKITNKRQKIRKIYDKEFQDISDRKLIKLVKVRKKLVLSEYIYVILLNEKKLDVSRDDLIEYLRKNNIITTVHYIPANKHNYYRKKFKKVNLKNSDYVYRNIISLPFHNKLKKREIFYITELVNNYLSNNEKK